MAIQGFSPVITRENKAAQKPAKIKEIRDRLYNDQSWAKTIGLALITFGAYGVHRLYSYLNLTSKATQLYKQLRQAYKFTEFSGLTKRIEKLKEAASPSEVATPQKMIDHILPTLKNEGYINTYKTGILEEVILASHEKKTLEITGDWTAVKSRIQQEVSQRSGELWKCLSRKTNASGGFIYAFRLKDEYDDVTGNKDFFGREENFDRMQSKLKEIFPAIELPGSSMLALDRSVPEGKFGVELKNARQHLAVLMELGYKSEHRKDGVYLYLPDQEALMANWEKLRESHPELPALNIQSSQGIADDLDFVKAYSTHDGILSTGKEFVHDHLAHILPTIGLILSSKRSGKSSYQSRKASLVRHFDPVYRRVMIGRWVCNTNGLQIPTKERNLLKKHLGKIEATLGSWVDIFSSLDNYADIKSQRDSYVKDFFAYWSTSKWRNYFNKRFGSFNEREMFQVNEQLEQYEKQFYALPKEVTQGVVTSLLSDDTQTI